MDKAKHNKSSNTTNYSRKKLQNCNFQHSLFCFLIETRLPPFYSWMFKRYIYMKAGKYFSQNNVMGNFCSPCWQNTHELAKTVQYSGGLLQLLHVTESSWQSVGCVVYVHHWCLGLDCSEGTGTGLCESAWACVLDSRSLCHLWTLGAARKIAHSYS